MRIVDSHLHLVDRGQLRYPWLDDVPGLARDWSLDDYLAEARAAGIEGAVHVEVDVADQDRERETAWIGASPDLVIGAVASCRPEEQGFAAYLERVAASPKLRGLRRILHTMPDELGHGTLFAENLRLLPRYALTFDLCVLARQLRIALHLARSCPDVQFILDHCGVPDVRGRALDPWRADLAAVARLPNVACKISGLVAYADPDGWSVEDLRPFVEHAIAVFGWDRVLWGSDWPVCNLTADLGRWVAATHDLLVGTSEDDKARLLGRNAERFYRLA